GALLETFQQLPPGMAASVVSLGETVLTLVTQSFQLGIRGAAPALAALTLSTIALAIVGRSVPQLNILSLGLGVNSLIAMSVMIAAVGLTAQLLGNQLEPTLSTLVEAMKPAGDCPNFWEPKMGLSPLGKHDE
ncbi:MAG: flagellar biosynthetic protein FliR, partial [Planctomycetes bacterium]|nr:flagellar biosynthetic protein FliR [Planctomycetota bacterium]